MNTLHVKKNDMVVVLTGAHKGKLGKVLAVDLKKQRVLVEGVNIVHKAMRKTQENPKGGILTREAAIPVAKVMRQDKHEARQKKRGVAPATQPKL